MQEAFEKLKGVDDSSAFKSYLKKHVKIETSIIVAMELDFRSISSFLIWWSDSFSLMIRIMGNIDPTTLTKPMSITLEAGQE